MSGFRVKQSHPLLRNLTISGTEQSYSSAPQSYSQLTQGGGNSIDFLSFGQSPAYNSYQTYQEQSKPKEASSKGLAIRTVNMAQIDLM